jgi:hypothetical protein
VPVCSNTGASTVAMAQCINVLTEWSSGYWLSLPRDEFRSIYGAFKRSATDSRV